MSRDIGRWYARPRMRDFGIVATSGRRSRFVTPSTPVFEDTSVSEVFAARTRPYRRADANGMGSAGRSRPVQPIRTRVDRARRHLRSRGKPRAHFLHIGKTGGSAMLRALRPVANSGAYDLQLHGHLTSLGDVPAGEKLFFGVRDPESRFVSGFYSRQRRGRKGHAFDWSADELEAFTVFESANQLAEALFSDERAARAMAVIGHVGTSYWDWFFDRDTFLSRTGDILFITRQSHLDADFARLVDVLGLSGIELPRDANRNPAPVEPLTSTAKDNLRRWYDADYEFFELCQRLLRP